MSKYIVYHTMVRIYRYVAANDCDVTRFPDLRSMYINFYKSLVFPSC